MFYALYGLALAVSISIWFIAVRTPLWEDETGSYWQINAGFSGIWSRQGICPPAYSYILWFFTKLIGTSEIALRIPSILAMLAAAYLLYLAALELFERPIAIIAAVIFCLNPFVIFASIDVRPYAFAVLAANAAILIVLRLRRNNSNWLAALFGLSLAFNVYFHYLFAVILPALAICFFAVKLRDRKTLWRQFGVALSVFALAFLPVIPGLLYLFHTRQTHVYENPPTLSDLTWTLAPGWLLPVICGAGIVALLIGASTGRRDRPLNGSEGWKILICASLALIPVLILYGISVGTPMHLFVAHHRLAAVPGITLCWAFFVSRFHSRAVRLLFCVALVATTASFYYSYPLSSRHMPSWKYALEFAEKNASVDDAPVLMCSGLVESNYAAMPLDSAKDSNLFPWLLYYKLSVPVVPLPQALNGEAIRVGSRFLQEATQKRERFLVLAHMPSIGTIEWLAHSASDAYSVRKLGVFDGVEVWEFLPRAQEDASR